jgi:hypothetical protein
MRTTAIALILSLFTASGVWAQDAATWRKVADSIPLGSKVKVQRIDGTRVSGTLMRADDTGVTVKKNTRLPEPAVTVAYDAIGNLERDHGGGMSWGKAIGIGLAAGASAIATIFVIALQWD